MKNNHRVHREHREKDFDNNGGLLSDHPQGDFNLSLNPFPMSFSDCRLPSLVSVPSVIPIPFSG